MIVLVRAVRIALVGDFAGRVGERIPDRASSAVFINRTLDLVRGSGGTPHEIRREAAIRASVRRRIGGSLI